MKKYWMLALSGLLFVACGGGSDDHEEVVPPTPDKPEVPEAKYENKNFTAGGVTFTMVAVEGGTFKMGALDTDADANDDEKPQHSVTLSDYYIGETLVTQVLWEAVMGSNPSKLVGDQLPLTNAPWDKCQEFITKLNEMTGQTFRMPTEAEWEYAARGGNKSQGCKYSGSNNLKLVAWYKDNSEEKTHEVGTKTANELGIYDMAGNVYEWCQDWYGYYSGEAQTNPTGPETGSYRILRGGCYTSETKDCRLSARARTWPIASFNDIGLRLALSR